MNIYQKLKQELGDRLKKDEVLAPYTTFKIGGPAAYFYSAKNDEDFIKAVKIAKKLNIPYLILGGGSNLLISDKGFSGLVIKKENNIYSRDFKIIENKIITGSQVKLSVLVEASAESGLTGLEWAAGIPGTVGGAVRGNAGAYGKQMSDVVKTVKALCDLGEGKFLEKIYTNQEAMFFYRSSIFKKFKKCVILSVEIELEKGDKKEIKKTIEKILNLRKKSSAPQYPSAGCIFKNPVVKNKKLIQEFQKDTGKKIHSDKVPAGYLIDRLGLKSKKIGGAMISDKNANFILNIGNATAEDVIILISFIKQQVRDKYGIQLEEEVELVGF